mmetsp:Transcript_29254/g.56722  ORF Transcript_29254/g.56722 Transcript_29254/m.56722 type:complete len:299 (-) Transcript_29254:2464-3360(-)
MHTNGCRLGIDAGPFGAHGGGVVMRGTVGQVGRTAIQYGTGHLAHPFPGARLADMFGVTVAGIGELALIFAPRSLVDHTTDIVGKACALDPVHDHLGHGKLAFHGLAARFEIERFGQALPMRTAGCLGLVIDPGACEFHVARRFRLDHQVLEPCRGHAAQALFLDFQQGVARFSVRRQGGCRGHQKYSRCYFKYVAHRTPQTCFNSGHLEKNGAKVYLTGEKVAGTGRVAPMAQPQKSLMWWSAFRPLTRSCRRSPVARRPVAPPEPGRASTRHSQSPPPGKMQSIRGHPHARRRATG